MVLYIIYHVNNFATKTCGFATFHYSASVEMIGSVNLPTLLSLSIVAEVDALVLGVTGNIEFPFNWLKE